MPPMHKFRILKKLPTKRHKVRHKPSVVEGNRQFWGNLKDNTFYLDGKMNFEEEIVKLGVIENSEEIERG